MNEPHAVRGDCPFCGYSMSGIESIACPECGKAITAESYADAWPRRLEGIVIAGLLGSGLLLFLTGVLSFLSVPLVVAALAMVLRASPPGPRYAHWLMPLALAAWSPIVLAIFAAGALGLRALGLFP